MKTPARPEGPAFGALRLLACGDVMLDEYLDTEVSRISPEAPVPVALVRRRRLAPGGAANTALNLARLGCRVALAGLRGRDAAGRALSGFMEKEGVEDFLQIGPRRVTTKKTRLMAQGQQMLRLDREAPSPPSGEEYAALSAALGEIIPRCQGVILSDYAKGLFGRMPDGRSLAREAIALASARGLPVFVDPKGRDWDLYAGADCVTPNEREFEALAGPASGRARRGEMAAKAGELVARYRLGRLMVTLGAKGLALFEKGAAPLWLKAEAKEVIDVSGAGDTVIATLAACRAAGLSWAEAADLANRAGGAAVSKAGTRPIDGREFEILRRARAAGANS